MDDTRRNAIEMRIRSWYKTQSYFVEWSQIWTKGLNAFRPFSVQANQHQLEDLML